ncbi:MAG TPA: HAMP domain-containing sensor histidine kinase [Candidatus Hydrogenedentes bacterium]|nr:HAMP domain-containing sensor histidine kinase [Candidatus Hydrogenedentota bacterium]
MASTGETYPRVRWRSSIIMRVIVLCVVLVLCLLGSVVVITRHYLVEVVREMETQAKTVGDYVVVQIKENPGRDLDGLANEMMDLHPGFDEIALEEGQTSGHPVTIEPGFGGELMKVARLPLRLADGREVLLTIRVSSRAQTEIVQAFKNTYLLVLALVFVVALVLMIYLIVKTLRPLRDLSQSCAAISSGDLRDVNIGRNTGEVRALEETFNQMVASLREKEVMEAKLRQAQRVSALGNLAAGVAHDLRNPLNTIKLLVSHAADSIPAQEASAGALKQLSTVGNEVRRIEEIVSGFLSLAKERELQPEPIRVDSLLEECLRLVSKDAERRKVLLSAELRAGDATLMLDPKLWTRAILNVLLNALDACPEGARVRLFSRATDSMCEIEVRDSGVGLSKEVAERAFDPYYTTKDTGTGLGLSVTRGIVEEHGGSITLSGAEGEGCQVLIALPLSGPGA